MESFITADESLDLHDWTVGNLLEHAAEQAPERVAILQPAQSEGEEDLSWTYAQLLHDSHQLANYLLTIFSPGDHVAIWGANSAQWAIYQLAAAQAGLILVTANPALRSTEISYLLSHSKAVGVIMDKEHRGVDLIAIVDELRPDLPHLQHVLPISDFESHLQAGQGGDEPLNHARPDDVALILYTSGTTGKPKAVRLRHRGIVNNAALGSQRYELSEGSAWLHTLPMFHVGGSVTMTLGCIAMVSTSVILRAFDGGITLKLCQENRIAMLPVVPTMLIAMIEHEDFAKTDLSALELLLTGGTVIAPDFVRMAKQKLGADVQVMFGQTEAGGAMCKTFRSDPEQRIAETVGRPYPHTALKIAALDGAGLCETGDIGEIRIKSPFMMAGYFDNVEADQSAFDEDGFLRTGDLGRVDDDGYVRVTGRLKEMVIRGGENIYPREVEDALNEFAEVAECAVLGVPDPKWGEELVAVLRPAAGADLDIDRITDELRETIARHKVPKKWRVVKDFPRTPSGKIQKFELISLFAEDQD
ncbi:class I adenylate-forming enzyme family protein [Aurantiacibacter rhizosphaerae]|nr:class I adenylate-forming enzyme family protein [Aurantiacibacter rhizosphaerae]